jgi:hypothetical protein
MKQFLFCDPIFSAFIDEIFKLLRANVSIKSNWESSAFVSYTRADICEVRCLTS